MARLKNEILAVILVLLVAGSLGVGYFAGTSNQQTTTVTSTSGRVTTRVYDVTFQQIPCASGSLSRGP